jgi:L-threonylcarbamoyladenylate synthase
VRKLVIVLDAPYNNESSFKKTAETLASEHVTVVPFEEPVSLEGADVLVTGSMKSAMRVLSAEVIPMLVLGNEQPPEQRDIPEQVCFFHSFEDALRWVGSHPEGWDSLEHEIEAGVKVIKEGGLTAFPTETVYGLGADALNAEAVRKIFIAKKRPYQDPLISHVASIDQAANLVKEIPETAKKLMDAFWPGPLTLVLPKHPRVPDIVSAGNPTVAVRMPHNRIARMLIERSGTPIAAPSANSFGKTSPTTAKHVIDQLHGRFDAIIDGGACRVGVESTVLSLVSQTPVLLRPGGVTIEEIEQVVGPIEIDSGKKHEHFDSPGMFPSHYAPNTPMIVVDDPQQYRHERHIAIMLFHPPRVEYAGTVFMLSQTGSDSEAAAGLYRTMREIDEGQYRLIVAERLPQKGMGIAVNDRMGRASST